MVRARSFIRSFVAPLCILVALPPAGFPAEGDAVSPEISRARALVEAGDFETAIDLLREAAGKSPFDAVLRVELARAGVGLARRVAAEDDAGFAALAWVDAVGYLEEALRLDPANAEVRRLLAEAAEGAGQPGKAADALLALLLPAPADPALWRRAGHALLAADRAAEAVEAFRTAEAIGGPEAGALLARARAHDVAGQPGEALEVAARLFRLEADRGAPESPEARAALALLWSAARRGGLLDRLEAIHAGWCDRYPQLTAPPYYLGFLRQARGRPVRAVEAYRMLAERAPGWAAGWRLLAGSLAGSGKAAEAADALGKATALDADGAEDARLLQAIARAAAMADVPGALVLLDRFPEIEAGDRDLRRLRGDLLLRAGRAREAVPRFAALVAEEPSDPAVAVRLQKAVAALLADGTSRPEEAALRRAPAQAPGAPASLADFEAPQVLVRLSRGAEGRREAGTFRFSRRPDRESLAARLSVQLLPEIDSRPFDAVRFAVRGPAGVLLRIGAKDRWDDYDLELPAMNRLFHRETVRLIGDRQVVVLPLDGFVASADTGAEIRITRDALRALTFEIVPSGPEPWAEVEVDDVGLQASGGAPEVLADFEADAAEVIASFEGAAAPLQSVPRIGQTLEDYPADATTFVAPHLLGPEYVPAMACSGRGSVRVACSTRNTPGDGRPAALRLTFLPPRDFSAARALVFRARGQKGGERLALTIADAVDEELGAEGAAAPRDFAGRRLVAGLFTLAPEWGTFRVPLGDYPEVDLRAVRFLRFVVGGDLNDPSVRVYLDDIGLE